MIDLCFPSSNAMVSSCSNKRFVHIQTCTMVSIVAQSLRMKLTTINRSEMHILMTSSIWTTFETLIKTYFSLADLNPKTKFSFLWIKAWWIVKSLDYAVIITDRHGRQTRRQILDSLMVVTETAREMEEERISQMLQTQTLQISVHYLFTCMTVSAFGPTANS